MHTMTMSKKMVVRVVALASVLSLSSGAIAQQEPQPVEYQFDDDLVAGELPSAFGDLLRTQSSKSRTSLIQVRNHFVPEMYKSVEQL